MQSTFDLPEDGPQGPGLPYLTIVSAIALAIAAVVGLSGGLPDLSPPAKAPPQPAQAPREARPADPGRILVYLVGTEAEKRALQYDISIDREWFAESYAGAETSVQIVVLAEEQEESLDALAELLPNAMLGTGHGPEVKLVDMR